MSDPLPSLAQANWYKALIVASYVTFVLGCIDLLPAGPAAPTILASLGGFLIGVGEWINHTTETQLISASVSGPAYQLRRTIRQPVTLGSIFNAIGAVLVGNGLIVVVSDVFAT